MIQLGDDTMTPGIRECWKKSFTLEDPRYLEHFFRYIYKPEYFYVDMEGRDVAATICRIPHALMFNGRVLQASMLSHAGTLPDYRNEGRMQKMIEVAVDACSHTELITLVTPEYSESYRPFGFEPIYKRTSYLLSREDAKTSSYGCSYEPSPLDMLKVFAAFIRRFNGYFARDVEYFVNLKREINARGGKIVAYYNEKNEIRGYATILINARDARIEECIYLDSVALYKLIAAAFQERAMVSVEVSGAENLSKLFPNAERKEFPVMLARLNEPKLFSRLFNKEVRTIQEAYAISGRPLYINEKI